MKLSDSAKTKMVIYFNSISDITQFKQECDFNDFYIDRDSISLVGSFTDDQLQIATSKYLALCKMDLL